MKARKLLEAGRGKEAIEAFTRKLRRDKSDMNYSGRAEAYFQLKDYDSALADYHWANAVTNNTTTYYFQRIGVVNWLARREYAAAGTWLEATLATEQGKIQYTDGAGGVGPGCLLWFAGVSLECATLLIPARRLLEKKVSQKTGMNWQIDNWPGPVAMYLLGILDEKQLRDRIIDVPIARERELCQAEFYVGVRALEEHDTVRAKRAFSNAARLHEASIENEYDLAQRESRRLVQQRSICCALQPP